MADVRGSGNGRNSNRSKIKNPFEQIKVVVTKNDGTQVGLQGTRGDVELKLFKNKDRIKYYWEVK